MLLEEYKYKIMSRTRSQAIARTPVNFHSSAGLHLCTQRKQRFPSCFVSHSPFELNVKNKMVNGSRYYRALESVSIASALSTALTIYPC